MAWFDWVLYFFRTYLFNLDFMSAHFGVWFLFAVATFVVGSIIFSILSFIIRALIPKPPPKIPPKPTARPRIVDTQIHVAQAADELTKLKNLLDMDVINQEEFDRMKEKVVSDATDSSS